MIQNLQRIQIKLPSNAPASLNLDPLLAIFGRWRKDMEDPAEWVDLADYGHMLRGPGIVLAGMRVNLAFDMDEPHPGFLYTSRKGLAGSNQERIASAFQSCFSYAKRLLGEKEFPSGVELLPGPVELRFIDRLETPNTAATDKELRPILSKVLDSLFGPGDYSLEQQTGSGESYGFRIYVAKPERFELLLNGNGVATKRP